MSYLVIEGGDGEPVEPDWSRLYRAKGDIERAHEQWGIVVRELRDGQALAVANGHAIARLVQFRIVFEKAARDIARLGIIRKAKRTFVPQIAPAWSVMRQAEEAIRSLEAELGLAPVRRGRIGKVQRGKKASSAAATYLGTR